MVEDDGEAVLGMSTRSLNTKARSHEGPQRILRFYVFSFPYTLGLSVLTGGPGSGILWLVARMEPGCSEIGPGKSS